MRGGHGLSPWRDDNRSLSTTPARLYQNSTTVDRCSTAALKAGAMSNRAHATGGIWILAPMGAAVAKTVDRGFDWGSAAVGAGLGAATTLLLIALGAVTLSRRTGPDHRGGSPS